MEDLILPAALLIGGYFLLKTLRTGVESVTAPLAESWHMITTPGYQLIEEGLEGAGIDTRPGYQILGDALKDVKLPGLPDIDMRPGYQILGDMLNPTPEAQTLPGNTPAQIAANVSMAAVRKSTPMYAAGKYVALDTAKVMPYTAPEQQIITYNLAPKIVAGKKVM